MEVSVIICLVLWCLSIGGVVSFRWGCGVFPLGVWCLSIGGVVSLLWSVMSFHWGCGVFPLRVWCLSIGVWHISIGVWCLSIVIGHVNKKEHEMTCVDTCGAFVGA